MPSFHEQIDRAIEDWVTSEIDRRVDRAVTARLEPIRRAVAGLRRRMAAQEQSITTLGGRMTSVEQEQYERGAQLVGLIKAEFASLHSQLDAALADRDVAVAAGVESALNEDSAADAERIKGLLDELASVLPADVPDVPVPDPGQPAELPTEPVEEPVSEPAPAEEPSPVVDPAEDQNPPA